MKEDTTKKNKIESKMLGKSAEKSLTSTDLAHALRTSLSAANSGIAMLLEGLDGTLNSNQRETLTIIKKNIDRIERLIQENF